MSDERPQAEEIIIDGGEGSDLTPEELLGAGKVNIDKLEKPKDEEPPAKVDPKTLRLEGEEYPEELRGKSLSDVIDHTRRLESALRISEQGRVAAAQVPLAPPPPVTPPAEEPELNREEITQLLQTDAVAGVQALINQAMTRAEKHMERRLGGITAGAASTAEAHARQLYPMEFELFGSQIRKFVDLMPDKTPLSSSDGWDNAIAYIRGLRGNIEQYMDAVAKKNGKEPPAPAPGPRREAATAGPVLRGQRTPITPSAARVTDPTEREVMAELNFDPDDPKSVREWNYWKGQK